jgi:ketohexokinase
MATVLAVGIATVDVINTVASYPGEDDEVRALSHSVRRGGNATNTLVVLSQLGHVCEWAGVWVEEPDAEIVRADLDRYAIGSRYCKRVTQGKTPTSYITCSRATASRTIVHYRDLPEYDSASFLKIPLETLDWVHFEGRNVGETLHMMEHLRRRFPGVPVSLELEKPREGIEALFPYANLLLFAQAFADHCGASPEVMLRTISNHLPHTDMVCTLSERGAVGLNRSGELLFSSAYPPPELVDTLGAGDTFNAAMIDAALRGESLSAALEFACRLAGAKCGQVGLHGLGRSIRAGRDG